MSEELKYLDADELAMYNSPSATWPEKRLVYQRLNAARKELADTKEKFAGCPIAMPADLALMKERAKKLEAELAELYEEKQGIADSLISLRNQLCNSIESNESTSRKLRKEALSHAGTFQKLARALEELAELKSVADALIANDGHMTNCAFRGCTCGRVEGYKTARGEYVRLRSGYALPAPPEEKEKM